MDLSLRQIARSLGGEIYGRQVVAPGPGHSRSDRSLSVKLSPSAPEGFLATSYAGDDWRLCRDYVRERCGLGGSETSRRREVVSPGATRRQREVLDNRSPPTPSDVERIRRARKLWVEGIDPRDTLAAVYLASRALILPDDIAGEVLRFHPTVPWKHDSGELVRVPAMLTAMRGIHCNAVTAVQATALLPSGTKIGRRMRGVAAGNAIKVDADENVTTGLFVGEGLETCLAARQIGFKPVWALASIGAIAAFPVLSSVEAITILE